MKNLVEILFEFKDVGSEVIDQNREKLMAMAKIMQDASKQASRLAGTHQEINDSLNETTEVYKKKTKAEREAEAESRKIAKEANDRAKQELQMQKDKANEEKKIAKEKLANDRQIAAEAKKVADEQRAIAKQKAAEEKSAAVEQKKIDQARIEQEKLVLAETKKRAAAQKAIEKQRIADERAVAAATKKRMAEEKAALKAQSDQDKANARLAIQNAKDIEAKKKELLKQRMAEEKTAAAATKAITKEEQAIKDAAFLQERLQLVEYLKQKRLKEQAEKSAMLAANRAAREAERAAAQEIKAKQKVAAASQKAADAAAKAASKNKGGGGGSGGAGGNPANDVGLMGKANAQMSGAIKNMNLIKLGMVGIVAAAGAAIVKFARDSADEFYKMKLASEANGFDVSELQAYKTTLDAVGITTDQFAQKLRMLNEKFVEGFTEDSGDGMEVIKTLNLEMEKFAKASPEKKFEMIVDATKDLSKVQRLQIFDKLSLDELNLVANRMDKVRERKEELQKSGLIVTDEEAGRLKDIEQSWSAWTDELAAFSTIIYSAVIPAFQDAFGGIFDGLKLSRNGANGFAIVLIEIVQFFAKITAFGKLMFDLVIGKFKQWGIYAGAAADGLVHMFNVMRINLKGAVNVIKQIDIGAAIAGLAKSTFSSIIDVIFSAMDSIVSGIEKVAGAISGVIPDSILNQISGTRQAIAGMRSNLYTYEKSEAEKHNDELIKIEQDRVDAELAAEQKGWDEKKKINKKGLDENTKQRKDNYKKFDDKMASFKPAEDYLKTDSQLEQDLKKVEQADNKPLKKMETDIERRTKLIDRLMGRAEIIKQQIELGIADPITGLVPTLGQAFSYYDKAIGVAAGNAKLLNKELALRVQRRDDEKDALDKQYTKSTDNIKKSIDNLKLIDDMTGENFFGNQEKIVAKYDDMIALARTYKKDELDVNSIIKERADYIKAAADAQTAYNKTIQDLETSLLSEQGKDQEVRDRERLQALKDVEKEFENASPAQRQRALDLTDSLFNIKNAKARISELDAEIDKLVDKRNSKTDVFDRTKMLELETQINSKIAERGTLEKSIGKEREEANDDFKITIEDINGILEDTFSNLSTLVTSTVSGVETLQDAMKNFFNSTLQSLAQLLQRLLMIQAMKLVGSYFGFDSGSAGGLSSLVSGGGGGGASARAASLPEYHIGGAVTGKQATGTFSAMGPLSANEINAKLNKKEAVLTEAQQANLGNALASTDGTSAGNITAVIHNNINAGSLTTAISSTKEWKDAIKNEITRERSTYRQILN